MILPQINSPHHQAPKKPAFLIDSLLQEPCQFHRKLRQLIVGGQFLAHPLPRNQSVEVGDNKDDQLWIIQLMITLIIDHELLMMLIIIIHIYIYIYQDYY